MNDQLAFVFGLIRRFPFCSACIVATLALTGGAWVLWDQVQELEATHKERTKEGEAMLALLVGGSTQRQELAAVHEAARRIEDNLVVETNLAENAWYFFKFEEQTKIRLTDLHPLNSPPTDTSPIFRRVPYTLRASGTFDQIYAFVGAIETGPRLARITAFNFSRQAGGAAIMLDLSIDMLGKR
jgi:Tfp pilus assembly protein PilO